MSLHLLIEPEFASASTHNVVSTIGAQSFPHSFEGLVYDLNVILIVRLVSSFQCVSPDISFRDSDTGVAYQVNKQR
jgi:hypothetical protein